MGRPPYDEEPSWVAFDAWQRSDDEHPAGTGRPAYRVVYKTLRVALRPAELRWADLIMRFVDGRAERGGVHTPGALTARRHDHLILPEWGGLVPDPADQHSLIYQPVAYVNPTYQGIQEDTEPCFHVEIIADVAADRPDVKLMEGRARVASLLTMLDLHFGTRFLGVGLTEEAGERFDDWHFNRHLGVSRMGWEPELDVAGIDRPDVEAWAHDVMDRYMGLPQEHRQRVGLASQWYQQAVAAADPVMEFVGLWVAAEVLAMPNTTNVRLLRERLGQLAGGAESDWKWFIGRLFSRRSDLVHGTRREVAGAEIVALRAVVRLLLVAEFGLNLPDRVAAVEAAREQLTHER